MVAGIFSAAVRAIIQQHSSLVPRPTLKGERVVSRCQTLVASLLSLTVSDNRLATRVWQRETRERVGQSGSGNETSSIASYSTCK